MRNVAYTSEYKEYRNKLKFVFNDKYLHNIETRMLTQDLSLEIHSYQDLSQSNYPYIVHCTTAYVINKKEEIVYSTQNINDDAAFFDFVEHKNGKKYLIFRIDLYGYSILDLSTMEDYHYIPEESFNGGETFIWAATHYNKATNLLLIRFY